VWYLLALAHHGACQFADARECIESGEKLIRTHAAEDGEGVDEGKAAEFTELKAAVEESAKAMGDDDMEDGDDDMADN
jgi:hypothetical protein